MVIGYLNFHVIEQLNNTILSSTKKTPIQASEKSNEKVVFSYPQVEKHKQKPRYKIGQLVRTDDIINVFREKDSRNFS